LALFPPTKYVTWLAIRSNLPGVAREAAPPLDLVEIHVV